jgi:hypothetical protein
MLTILSLGGLLMILSQKTLNERAAAACQLRLAGDWPRPSGRPTPPGAKPPPARRSAKLTMKTRCRRMTKTQCLQRPRRVLMIRPR